MQLRGIRNEALIEIGTFLARRWSGNEKVTIEFSEKNEPGTRIRDSRIILLSVERLEGGGLDVYRQFRTALWREAMRLGMCKKILSNDHAYGFILNAIETRRMEVLGRKIWGGMDGELIFDYAYQWNYRPQLGSVYGKARIVEGFYQYFLFGDTKGEIAANHLERIKKAAGFAHKILKEAIRDGYGTAWLEKKIPKIIAMLEIDSLLTVPVSLPWTRRGMAMTEEELLKTMVRVSRGSGDFGKADPRALMRGDSIRGEYKVLTDEYKKNEDSGSAGTIGVQVPSRTDVDETTIYDIDLISGLKTRFKDWKSGWSEEHLGSGDEFDGEAYIDGQKPFFTDVKKTIKAEITIMLDHSSSISADQLEYKKATLALCEVLSYLKIRFAVYAFSTVDKAIVCWLVKSASQKWNSVCAKRLVQIAANGGTPLAEVYERMYPVLQSRQRRIFLTLTDGEPSDPGRVRSVISSLRGTGVKMAALGMGPDTIRATAIASNLKRLGYERALAVSRIGDIPNKVLEILGED